jgi:hypothetical protein
VSARDRIARALCVEVGIRNPDPEAITAAHEVADVIIDEIRAMTPDQLRELRPDIATLFDATRENAQARAEFIAYRAARRKSAGGAS